MNMNNKIKSNRLLLTSISFSLFCLLQGCAANLPAVREFSKATVLTSEPFNQVLDDIPKSCERRVDVKIVNKYEIPEGSYDVRLTDEYKDDLALCAGYEKATEKILLAHDVLQNYAEALGKLASDDVVTFNKETSDLKSSLENFKLNGTPIFQESEANAASKIAEFLFDLAVKGYRQKKLNETINMAGKPIDQDPKLYCQSDNHDETGSNLAELINGLANFINFYKNELKNELNTTVAQRDNLIENFWEINKEINSYQRKNRTLAILLEEKRDNTKYEIIQREAQIYAAKSRLSAADAYIEILGQISSTHKEVYCYSIIKQLNSPEMINEIKTYVQQLLPLLNLITITYSK